MNTDKKPYLIIASLGILIVALLFLVFYLVTSDPGIENVSTENVPSEVLEGETSTQLEYTNPNYGFGMYLPQSWEGYSVVEDEWQGYGIITNTMEVVASGPVIYLRHPEWDYKSPRQDIPIMVFTKLQWDSMLNDRFHIGAGPINPTELGRNYLYVFAVPARYNYSFLRGFEEVEEILNNGSFYSF